jgi:hypothetical protein
MGQMWPVWGLLRFACDEGQREQLDALFDPASMPRDAWFAETAVWYRAQDDLAARCSALREYGRASLRKYLEASADRKVR